MTAFDFDSMEAALAAVRSPSDLRKHAVEAWRVAEAQARADLTALALDAIERILNEVNGTDAEVELGDEDGTGNVQVTVDGMRFRYIRDTSRSADDGYKEALGVKTGAFSWAGVRHLADLGRAIQRGVVLDVEPHIERGTE